MKVKRELLNAFLGSYYGAFISSTYIMLEQTSSRKFKDYDQMCFPCLSRREKRHAARRV